MKRVRQIILHSFTILSLLLSGTNSLSDTAQAAPSGLGTERYVVPLIGNFSIGRTDLETLHNDHNLYTLLGPLNHQIESVRKVAVSGSFIVGETTDGYFLFNSTDENPIPQTFSTLKALQSALIANGLTKDISLNDPDVLAAALSNRTIRPWEYRMMNGRFGLSDDDWGGAIVLLGWPFAFGVGWRVKRRGLLLAIAIVIGSATNFVGRIILAGGGPAAGVGLVFEPLVCFVAAILGRGMRKAFHLHRTRPILQETRTATSPL